MSASTNVVPFPQSGVDAWIDEYHQGYSVSHRNRVKSVIHGFCQWLIEKKGALNCNPTRGIEIPAVSTLAPHELSPDQRLLLGNLVERRGDLRGAALFALGYWAGCRVSDLAYLHVEDAHVGPKIGWLHWFRDLKGHAGNSLLHSRFMTSVMILPIGHVRWVGPWRSSRTTWGM